jgi:hypothetical protein
MEPYWGVEIELHALVTSHLMAVYGRFYVLAALFPGRKTPEPVGFGIGGMRECRAV